MISNGAPN